MTTPAPAQTQSVPAPVEKIQVRVNGKEVEAGDIVTEAKKKSDNLISDAKRKADTLLVDAENVLKDARQKAGPLTEEAAKVKNAVKAGVDAFRDERRRS